jgi:hypothetical protein
MNASVNFMVNVLSQDDFIHGFLQEREQLLLLDLVRFCTKKGYPVRRRNAVWNFTYKKLEATQNPLMIEETQLEFFKTVVLQGYYFKDDVSNVNWKNEMRGMLPYRERIHGLKYVQCRDLSFQNTDEYGMQTIISHYSRYPWCVRVKWESKMQFNIEGIVPIEDLVLLSPDAHATVTALEDNDEKGYEAYVEAKDIKGEEL